MARKQGKLAGKVALVVGAASGIGQATAKALAAEGASILVADRDARGAAALAERLKSPHFWTDWIALDVTKEKDWAMAAGRLSEVHGKLHILVNTAGSSAASPIERTTLTEWRQLMAVNVDGAFLGLKHCLPLMRQTGGGSVVLVGSASGHKPSPGTAAYSTSKAALMMLARTAALEAAGDRIRVNTVSPGGVKTPMWENSAWWPEHVRKAGGEAQAWAALSQAVPLQRFADPEEVAKLIAYLASDDAAFVTGSDFSIDGGFAIS